MKRAFTLIELLVVIAIIAILAAILFPVFAQAKASAKAAASVSTVKQQLLAEQMYAGDSDDVMVRVGNWNSSDPDAWVGGWASWALMMDPYVKNIDMNNSPLTTSPVLASDIRRRVGTRLMSYGYNYMYLSPSRCCTWPTPIESMSSTAVASPAETIMFAERNNPGTSVAPRSAYWYGAGVGWMIVGTLENPYCYNDPNFWCTDGWGVDSWYATTYLPGATFEEGKLTGGVAFRSAKNNIVGMCDGSVKKMAAGKMASGTNWHIGITDSAQVLTDVTKFMWDTGQ